MEKTNLKIDTLSDEENRKLYEEWRRSLRPCDDVLMSKVFLHKECVEYVLKTILKLIDLEIVKVETQKTVSGIEPDARGVRFDVLAWDKYGRPYDIEIQRDRNGMSIRRTRIYGDVVDLLAAKRGMDFDDQPNSYVIFICGFDMFGEGFPVYDEAPIILQTGKINRHGKYVKYLNAPLLMQDTDTELGRLMSDLWCADPKKMYNRTLADVVEYYKEDKGGDMEFTGYMADLVAYKEAKAEARGKLGTSMKALKALMHHMNLSADKAMDALDFDVEVREQLKKQLLQESEDLESNK